MNMYIEIAQRSWTDRSESESQKCISRIPAGSEQYSNRRLRRFPLCTLWQKIRLNLRNLWINLVFFTIKIIICLTFI